MPTVTPPVKVALVDDHDILRAGVSAFLTSLPGYALVGEADSARAGIAMIESERPDVILMDVVLPGMDGIVATREILRRLPDARVVALSAHAEMHDVIDAINAGVVGYVLKADPPDTLLDALAHAMQGSFYVAPALRERLSAYTSAKGSNADVLDILSEREREIFRLAADCTTATEIAGELCISRKTVDCHLHNINRKLGLHDRAQLVRLAVRIGLVHAVRSPSGEIRSHRDPMV
jgi:two-component system response regulator NreC